tara:strand:- start:9865 stop:10407 length:543 start_codon:yes stop_codon:yes gene_type:complete
MCGRYTPKDAINAIFHHFVTLGGLPAVGSDGTKFYFEKGAGCAVTVLATPEMRKMLAQTNHHLSPASSMDERIPLWDLISAAGWDRFRIMQFVQSLQDAHDAAADEYVASIRNGDNQGRAHDIFCGRLTRELSNISRSFDMHDLARDLKLRDRPQRYSQPDEAIESAAPQFTETGDLITA